MPRYGSRGRTPVLRTAPVLAVLVCHDGEAWLPDALAALRASTPRPRHVLAVDNGSLDATARLLGDAASGENRVVDGVLTRDRRTGFATAVRDAVSAAVERWGDPGGWIWVLHDDCAPEPDCLATLLRAAEASPSAGVLGPLALDWDDPRLVVEAGLSTDAAGHRQTGLGPSELDWSRLGRQYGQSTEVLAVPSAGMLVRRALWDRLGGFDPAIPLLREDIDFGWRANHAGEVVLCVPAARLRHVRAVPSGLRHTGAGPHGSVAALDRVYGLRTFLLNCSLVSFLVGIPRLTALSLVRALGFAAGRRLDECRAELLAVRHLLGGGLLAGRRARRPTIEVRSVRGLFTSRLTRIRNAVHAGIAHLVRRRLQADAALGHLPNPTAGDALWLPADATGPQALPAGLVGERGSRGWPGSPGGSVGERGGRGPVGAGEPGSAGLGESGLSAGLGDDSGSSSGSVGERGAAGADESGSVGVGESGLPSGLAGDSGPWGRVGEFGAPDGVAGSGLSGGLVGGSGSSGGVAGSGPSDGSVDEFGSPESGRSGGSVGEPGSRDVVGGSGSPAGGVGDPDSPDRSAGARSPIDETGPSAESAGGGGSQSRAGEPGLDDTRARSTGDSPGGSGTPALSAGLADEPGSRGPGRLAAGAERPVAGPEALPDGVGGRRPRRPAGLRRPATAVAVSLTLPDLPRGLRPSPTRRPSPVPRDGSRPARPDLVVVRVDRARLARQVLLAPPVLLVVTLLAVGIAVNAGRFGGPLAGGRLLPVPDLGELWSTYLATWHPVAGGTAAPAPAALAVVGVFGALLAPFGGGPAEVVSWLLFGSVPLAGLAAYVATRRMPVARWGRALAAAGYALLPPGITAVAQGRLDVVVAHVLLPVVTAGIVALLGRARTDSSRWLSIAAASAFGLAVLGAFAPLVHLLLVAFALAGFVVVPGLRGDGRRRVVALFVVVLLPVALLAPWPAVLIQHPGVVPHGTGAFLPGEPVTVMDLVALWPGGGGALWWVGALVVVAALAGLALRPRRAALPGLGLALLGVLAVVVVLRFPAVPLTGGPASTGWPGAGLLVVGWGLLLALLGTCQAGAPERDTARGVAALVRGPARDTVRRVAALAGVVGIVVMAVGAFTGRGGGPGGGPGGGLGGGLELAHTLERELTETGRSVLVLPHGHEPARMTAGRLPAFGDDDLPPVGDGAQLARIAGGFGTADGVRHAVAEAAAAGVLFVVPGSERAGDLIEDAAGDLVAGAPATGDGRPVLRLQLAAGQVTLLSPEQARRAVTGSTPPAELGAPGIVAVEAAPPGVAVRVSDGPAGRLLVIAAEDEPGWVATVDGRAVPVVRAWGHLVAVPLGTTAADVRVEQPTGLRGVLLLVQAATVLFVVLTAIPSRRPR